MIENIHTLFEKSSQCLSEVGVDRAASYLDAGLHAIRCHVDSTVWKESIIPEGRSASFYSQLLECPFTKHSTLRPHGYMGDAELIDYLYGVDLSAKLGDSSKTGQKLCLAWLSHPSGQAVRERRERIGHWIDEVATRIDHPDVFSLACGYLREIPASKAFSAGKLGRIVGLDQDVLSLEHIRNNWGVISRPELVEASAFSLLTHDNDIGTFDFIYSAGLFDYLDQRSCELLTAALFGMLKPGGQLVVGNFLGMTRGPAVMELIQDWWLVYKSSNEIKQFTVEVPHEEIEEKSFIEDHMRQIGYLTLTKKQ
jgi:hypothetical protein